MKFLLLPFFIFIANLQFCFGQYYSTALGQNGAQLKTSLHNIIQNHSTGTYADLWSDYFTTDNKVNGILWDIYSDVPGGTPPYVFLIGNMQCSGSNGPEGYCYNREHLWPSTFFGSTASPLYTDIQHVYPTDAVVNNEHGNLPMGNVKANGIAWTSLNGSKRGSSNTYAGYTNDVFEPIDSFKGDVARVYFYVSTLYENADAGWSNWQMANGANLTPDAIALLLAWHHLDPVSTKEINRNNAAYGIQGNRNPFIDYPQFADCIWGTSNCTALSSESVVYENAITIYPVPATTSLQIKIKSDVTISNYAIVDLIGNYVSRSTYSTSIDIANLPIGTYALLLQTNKGLVKKVFIKE
jgi:endonuclease I